MATYHISWLVSTYLNWGIISFAGTIQPPGSSGSRSIHAQFKESSREMNWTVNTHRTCHGFGPFLWWTSIQLPAIRKWWGGWGNIPSPNRDWRRRHNGPFRSFRFLNDWKKAGPRMFHSFLVQIKIKLEGFQIKLINVVSSDLQWISKYLISYHINTQQLVWYQKL